MDNKKNKHSQSQLKQWNRLKELLKLIWEIQHQF